MLKNRQIRTADRPDLLEMCDAIMLECNMSLISKNSYKIDFQINPKKARTILKDFLVF